MSLPLFVLVVVTTVAGPYKLSDNPPDFATREGQYLTRKNCERAAGWWNRHIVEMKALDKSPDTGTAVCIPQPKSE